MAVLCQDLSRGGFSDINPTIGFFIYLRDALKDLELNQGHEITELPVPRGGQGWVDMVKGVEKEQLATQQEEYEAEI
jgi:hypothetical protein